MLKEFQEAIEKEINSLTFQKPGELYEPIQYIMQLGGKRLRPLLCLLSYNLFAQEWKKILKPALALEIFHNFTLMHDDIMDNAPIRRGKQTIHKKWNSNVGILSGDVMLVKAYEHFTTVEGKYLLSVLNSFNKCATRVCEGQQMDMNFETQPAVSEKNYLSMIEKKTAALLGFSMELGGILGGQNSEVTEKLYNYGRNLGLAFQLKDDLLDVFGDEQFGKQSGGDIISNKKTFLLIKVLQKASGTDRKTLLYWLDQKEFDSEEKVKEVKAIYTRLKIREEAESRINGYFDLATENLRYFKANKNAWELLFSFTGNLKSREK
jgi:geranylgeranyl diphosphate synthase type II